MNKTEINDLRSHALYDQMKTDKRSRDMIDADVDAMLEKIDAGWDKAKPYTGLEYLRYVVSRAYEMGKAEGGTA